MRQVHPTLKKLDRAFIRLGDILAVIAGVIMVGLVILLFVDVVATKAFNRNIPHTIEIAANFHVPIVYLTLLAVQLGDSHANVELVYNKFPFLVKKICVLLWNVLGIVVCGFEAYTSVVYTAERFALGTLSGVTSGFPLWPISAVMVLGWVLMGLGCIWSIIRISTGLCGIPGTAAIEGEEESA